MTVEIYGYKKIERGKIMKREFTQAELDLIEKAMLNIIANGNTINPKVIDANPAEYRIAHDIMNVIDRVRG